MQVMKISVLLVTLLLGACGSLIESTGLATVKSREITASGTGYGVFFAKEMAMTMDAASSGSKTSHCEKNFVYQETKVMGRSYNQYRGTETVGPGDPRNRVYIRKSEKACTGREQVIRERNRAFDATRRGH